MLTTPQIGLVVRRLRKEAGFSQRAFARRIGCGLSAITNLERGVYQEISLSLFSEIAEVFGVTCSRFMRYMESQEEDENVTDMVTCYFSGRLRIMASRKKPVIRRDVCVVGHNDRRICRVAKPVVAASTVGKRG